MKIIHFSDLHIGVENYGRIDPDTGLSTRLNDFLSSFDQVVSYAVGEKVDLVILAGDVYKGRDPSQTHQREFAKRLSTLSRYNIPTFILVGNHDLPNTTTRANAVEIFPTLDVPNVYVGDKLETHLIKTRSGLLQILSVPWPRRGGILSREESKGMSIDEVRQEIESRMTVAIAQQSAALDPNIPAILTAHATVNGATVGTERSMMLGQDHILLVSALQKPQIDYVALGHIHKHQILRKDTPMVVYSGSLERVDFSEELDAKGFCVIDIDPLLPQGLRVTDFEFHSVSARPFVSIDVEVNDSDLAPNQAICDSISKINIQDSVVRVKIRVSQEMEHLINDRQIRDALNNAHYIAAITKDISNTTRPRLTADIADSLDPMEAVELYLQNRDIDKTHRASITQQAQELMAELENESASID
ncbi:MAG: exonuclease SbcCD subunit D [Chloroflexota bacterium]|nr:exonuclease SbcCD subunit D [Chloroflexota bacterium]